MRSEQSDEAAQWRRPVGQRANVGKQSGQLWDQHPGQWPWRWGGRETATAEAQKHVCFSDSSALFSLGGYHTMFSPVILIVLLLETTLPVDSLLQIDLISQLQCLNSLCECYLNDENVLFWGKEDIMRKERIRGYASHNYISSCVSSV